MSNNDKAFKVQNGLVVEGDVTASGTVTAPAFFGDGSGLTNVAGGSGGGLSQEAVTALITSTVDETYVQNHALSASDVTTQIESIVNEAYVIARQSGLTQLEVQNEIASIIDFRLSSLDWNFSRTVSAPNYKEGTHTYSATSAALQPGLGSLQSHSLTGDTVYIAHSNWEAGESLTLHVANTGGYAITWPTDVKWVGGTEPTCTTINVTHIANFWKVGGQLYGAYVGEAS